MEIKPFENKNEWNKFVRDNSPVVGAFFQSWEWGDFQEKIGNQIARFGVLEGGKLRGVALVVLRRLPLGITYAYLPRGPVFGDADWNNPSFLEKAAGGLKEAVQERFRGIAFIRFEPSREKTPYMGNMTFSLPKYYIQPRHNLVVGLKDFEASQKNFAKDLRGSIRKAERRGVSVSLKSRLTPEEAELFKKIRTEKNKRAGRGIFPGDAYFEMLEASLGECDLEGGTIPQGASAAYAVAYHEGRPVGVHLEVFFNKTATFLFGAVLPDMLHLRASPFLHFTAMEAARKNGFEYYDIGAVDANAWPSLSDFKFQFGSNVVSYCGNLDVVLKKAAYTAYSLLKILRK